MIRSMTGFGRGEVNSNGYQIICEMRGVNHRFLDFNLRISRRYNSLEDRVREKVKQRIGRGRIEIAFNIEKTGDTQRNIKVDNDLAMIYHKSLKDLAENLQISTELNIVDIFRLPEVFSLEEKETDLEDLWVGMDAALEAALDSLVSMRDKEGRALASDILERNSVILATVAKIETRSPQVVRDYAERMRKRINDLQADLNLDETRLIQEVAIFADRASIAEETVRLRSHCDQMETLLTAQDAVGRKGDFLIQEMFREVNTIASKANDLEISKMAVDLKAELEKMREQIQNIE